MSDSKQIQPRMLEQLIGEFVELQRQYREDTARLSNMLEATRAQHDHDHRTLVTFLGALVDATITALGTLGYRGRCSELRNLMVKLVEQSLSDDAGGE